MNKILITGAGGYIGSVAISLLLAKGYMVIAVDNFSTGYRAPLDLLKEKYPDTLKIYEVDLRGFFSNIFKENSIDIVLHYAAACSVNESMQKPEHYFSNNTCATQRLLHTMLDHNVKNIVFSSTCAVYGEAGYVPIDENHPTKPANPYGESKLMSENIIRWYGKLSGLNYVILRYFNVCGATDDGTIGDSKHPSPHLMQNAVRGALGIEPFNLTCGKFDTADGTPIRDYVNIVDLNEAHILAVEHLLSGKESQIINLGTGTGNSVMEIVQEVEAITGKKIGVKLGEVRKGEPEKLIASIEKAQKVLGWKPTHTLQDSVQSLVDWYTKHPQGWE
ncbi:UDP-glucose 4-epimerase GalE [Candidatus Roizmanbacteria bacterium CG_4_9_14_0_2_um_filter_39_13]|uniref:UDP-glucose 4-epimerase n=2 Tax=Candidatus Roizmaniibacteriota TaxID=1752723 RepID=A0A2M8EW67_9BACT|nr:MAG: UDP-glucose 4-epimerase GalE [Candidatus Roizmanbacteria bacterium CG_4_10_14_0_2_um_filter_39_12]PJC30114.1 MAG: UDP-glucose 4-epimerase GalE [Candidatus Roizmanbacteria bacterium CG_4_9_14_0_2_um_filter_39_13]PJE61541.1 MAG: UDP-glucose 4-epimerase GalE [Candidatus Roizmanbacteria bacterium CG10_big_fil_rev_8_21_14_0_10_39_12]